LAVYVQVRFIPQVPVLFGDTLREALGGPEHSLIEDVALWEALETVHMRTAVARLPEKLSTSMQAGAGDFSQVGNRNFKRQIHDCTIAI